MATYKVYVMAGRGTVVVDHATTAEMGARGYTDSAERELARSYARTGIAQAVRQGYGDVSAQIHNAQGIRLEVLEPEADR